MVSFAESLSISEIKTVKGALRAAVEGSFFPDWEFETLIGVSRETVRHVYEDWPEQRIPKREFGCAVIGSLNSLIGYPHGKDNELTEYVGAGRNEIKDVLAHLRMLGI